MDRRWLQVLVVGGLTAAGVAAQTPPTDLPPPVEDVRFLPEAAGADIGLPLGATSSYALGRSLWQQGDQDMGLLYLSRAYQLAPDSWRIAETFALALQDAGYRRDAVRIYGELVTREPDSLSARQQYALLLAQTGQPAAALEQARVLRDAGPATPDIVKLEADLLGQLDRVDEAVATYREACRLDPDHAEDYMLAAGALLQRRGRFSEMAELLREGLRTAPASQPLRLSLIRYLVHRGEVDQAIAEARAGDSARLATGDSLKPDCALELADLLARQGQVDTAAEVLTGALAPGQRQVDVETQIARYRLGLGEVAEASRILESIVAHWPTQAEPRYLWGRALVLEERPAEAIEQIRVATSLDPTQTLYRVSLLRMYLMHHRADLAVGPATDPGAAIRAEARSQALEAAATIQARDHEGHLILGYAFRALGDLERACQHFHHAGEVAESRVLARLELSLCLQDAERFDEAVEVLRGLQAEFPDDPEVANNLGYFLAEQGQDLEFAEQLIRQALRSDPRNGAYLDSLGWVLYQRGDYADAFNWLVEAANQRPDDPTILEHLAMTLVRLGKPREARDLLQRALASGGDERRLHDLIQGLPDEP